MATGQALMASSVVNGRWIDGFLLGLSRRSGTLDSGSSRRWQWGSRVQLSARPSRILDSAPLKTPGAGDSRMRRNVCAQDASTESLCNAGRLRRSGFRRTRTVGCRSGTMDVNTARMMRAVPKGTPARRTSISCSTKSDRSLTRRFGRKGRHRGTQRDRPARREAPRG